MLAAFDVHFKTINKDKNIHDATWDTYEFAIEMFHDLSEKFYAVKPSTDDEQDLIKTLYIQSDDLLDEINKAIKSESDEWVKNQLISKYDSLQQHCAKLQALICEDEDDKPVTKKLNVL
jgi:hypothetical protein